MSQEQEKGLTAVYAQLQGLFYIVHFVHPHGSIEHELVWSLYDEMCGHKTSTFPQFYGPFEGLEQMTKFCFRICDETNEPQVNLVTLEEFNQLVESATHIHLLRERLGSLGNIIANPDAVSKKGLFGKLFS